MMSPEHFTDEELEVLARVARSMDFAARTSGLVQRIGDPQRRGMLAWMRENFEYPDQPTTERAHSAAARFDQLPGELQKILRGRLLVAHRK